MSNTTKTTRRPNRVALARSPQASGLALALALFALASSGVHGARLLNQNNNNNNRHHHHQFAARRAADDARPLVRPPSWSGASGSSFEAAESQDSAAVVMGKFKAPAPEQIQQRRIPKSTQFASHTMSASYRVADASGAPEKVVHGITGASVAQRNQSKQRVVGAKIQVSDEGLNYPPSKLSADIYGNVAEIVTAPPEAVDNDFLLPNSHRFTALNRP